MLINRTNHKFRFVTIMFNADNLYIIYLASFLIIQHVELWPFYKFT